MEPDNINLIQPSGYSRYLFKFTIPFTTNHGLEAVVAYNRVTNKILSYIEKRVNTQFTDITSHSVDKYIGVVIENSIYDMFTDLEDINFEGGPNVDYVDIDDYVLRNGDSFRYDLFVFAKSVITNCIYELNKIGATTRMIGKPIETYTLTRSKLDPHTLEVYGYLEKII